ncbi:D-alanine--D-alanine ligase family protein [Streptomyces sp. NBC_01244]|uniref:D-alanine--D-alanine ligase family protein n=1 Tax=Streptomyces sp. NBC_01244 TaxID=2903797 RepID=UPI002E0E6444|nr:D-alanine--D-alanine ligase [Streptomyces sp. NBC_01244]
MAPVPNENPLVAVVTGGKSTERERSLLSGKAVFESLTNQGYRAVMLDTTAADFDTEVRNVDIAFLAIAGQHAEDGHLQGYLETIGVPYTGSGVLASATGMAKTVSKKLVAEAGIEVATTGLIEPGKTTGEIVADLLATVGLPLIVKPISEGGSIGMVLARDTDTLTTAIARIDAEQGWFAEPFVEGTPVTCGVLDVDGSLMPLPPLETLPTSAEFYDYASKRDDTLHEYRCPAELPADVIAFLQTSAVAAHRALGCSGHSRSDFIVTTAGQVVWLELNSLPGLSHHGNLATMANVAGIDYDQLVRMILTSADLSGGYRP